MEVEEPYGPSQYPSGTMPNKVNPEPSEWVEGLVKVVRGFALAMQDIQMLDNRDATRMPDGQIHPRKKRRRLEEIWIRIGLIVSTF
jgi:Adenylosuccinate lyase